jgi:hypothetical protein
VKQGLLTLFSLRHEPVRSEEEGTMNAGRHNENRAKHALLEYAAGGRAFRAADASRSLCIPLAAATCLLDEQVDTGTFERLRPIGCDHTRYDYYRLQDTLTVRGLRTDTTHTQHGKAPARPDPVMLPAAIRRAMTWLAVTLPLLLLVMRAGAGDAATHGRDLDTLDGLVGRWLDVRTTIAEEKRTWQMRRSQWEDEIRLLEREAESLKTEIASAGASTSTVEKERAVVLARKDAMAGELNRLREILDRAEADLRQWEARIPAGLKPRLENAFQTLPGSQALADGMPLAKRVQQVVALYTRIESLQHDFHATREMLETDTGPRRHVDVLYVGLACAYAVSPANDWAAVGVPSTQGWSWRACPDRAAGIRRALDVFHREQTAELLSLPMELAEERP